VTQLDLLSGVQKKFIFTSLLELLPCLNKLEATSALVEYQHEQWQDTEHISIRNYDISEDTHLTCMLWSIA